MAQTTLAVQTVERVRREQIDSTVCGVHMDSACIEFSSLEVLMAYCGHGSLGNFWKMAITTLNIHAYRS